jgi:hypothetical protein
LFIAPALARKANIRQGPDCGTLMPQCGNYDAATQQNRHFRARLRQIWRHEISLFY